MILIEFVFGDAIYIASCRIIAGAIWELMRVVGWFFLAKVVTAKNEPNGYKSATNGDD
jgi:hypothetical protein